MVEGAGGPVRAGDLGGSLHAGGIGYGGGRRGGLFTGDHHAVIDGIAVLRADGIHHLAVHPQQEGDGIAVGKPALAGEFIGGGGGADVVGRARHSDGSGRCPIGRNRSERTGNPIAVDPDGAEVGVIVVDVVLLHRREARGAAVAVDRDMIRAEGQLKSTGGGHIRALGVAADQSGVVHFPIGNGVPQRGAIDGPRAVPRRQQIVE